MKTVVVTPEIDPIKPKSLQVILVEPLSANVAYTVPNPGDYPIVPMKETEPKLVRRKKVARWPFDSLLVGTGFYEANAELFKSLRSRAHDYSKRTGKKLQCRIEKDGRMRCFMPTANQLEVIEEINPSRFEFSAYLSEFNVGEVKVLPAGLKHRFSQFALWIAEYAEGTSSKWAVSQINEALHIIRSE